MKTAARKTQHSKSNSRAVAPKEASGLTLRPKSVKSAARTVIRAHSRAFRELKKR